MTGTEDQRSADLVERFVRGEARAFDELYALHAEPLRALLRVIAKRADDSRLDDLSQKTWLAVMESARQWSRAVPFRAWLAGVARNVCLMEHRSRKRDAGTPRGEDGRASREPDPAERAALVAEVRATLAGLSPEEQEIVFQKRGEGRSFAEIAERTGVPVRTIQDRFHRAMDKIRPRLRSWGQRRSGEGRNP